MTGGVAGTRATRDGIGDNRTFQCTSRKTCALDRSRTLQHAAMRLGFVMAGYTR